MKIVNTLSIAILAMLSFGVHADMKQKILEQKRFVLYDSRRLTGECRKSSFRNEAQSGLYETKFPLVLLLISSII
jgi:hypothetical protein